MLMIQSSVSGVVSSAVSGDAEPASGSRARQTPMVIKRTHSIFILFPSFEIMQNMSKHTYATRRI